MRPAVRHLLCIRRASSRLYTTMISPITVSGLPSKNPDPATAKSHHVGGAPPTSFTNPWSSYHKLTLTSVLRTRFGSHPEKNFVPVPTGPDGARSKELVKIQTPTWGSDQNDRLRATWIGHASFLIEFPAIPGADRGIRLLLDPVFSERTSPVRWAGPKRYTPTPCSLDELPDVDIVCTSHNHYDHLDINTISHLYRKQKQGHTHFLSSLGNKSWFTQHIGCSDAEATEADWWDSFTFSVSGLGSVEITCCPAQHGSGRSIFDQGRTLWCSFVFSANGKSLYFSGDTAYQGFETPSPCPAFKQIGQIYGPFDLSLVPIGLCTPASFMGAVHATPEQSIEIHKEVRSKVSIGMHYGTVRGGISAHYEDVRDPPRRWRVAAEKEGVWCGGGVAGDGRSVDTSKEGVGLCDIGETVAV